MTRMTSEREDSRGELEDALGQLGVAIILLDDQVQLRLMQAIRRDHSLSDLLSPALDELGDINAAMESARNILGQVWEKNQDSDWGKPCAK